MAILALLTGLVSLFAPLSFVMLPLSILAIALGTVVLWRISSSSSFGGVRLAQIGLALGALSGAWTITASTSESAYLIEYAGKNAKMYLETLAAGEIYEALELRVPKDERQIAGTNLEQYYKAQTGEQADNVAQVMNARVTQAVMATGLAADWQLERGRSIISDGIIKIITVEMVNRANTTQRVLVTLRRRALPDESGRVEASWMISDASLEAKSSS